jgi:hypothetical protein
VVVRHLCLASHPHGSTVALQMHAGAVFVGPPNQSSVAKEIYCGLAVQKHDLPEVKLDPGIASSLEKLRDPLFEFFIDLRKVESVVQLKAGNGLVSIRFVNIGISFFQLCELSVSFLHTLEVLLVY